MPLTKTQRTNNLKLVWLRIYALCIANGISREMAAIVADHALTEYEQRQEQIHGSD